MSAVLEDSYYIDPARAEQGNMVPLTCVNHPELRWSTKNIAPIGCRRIFFDSQAIECSCPASDLRVVPL